MSGSPKTVLLIDDSDTVHRMLEWILKPTSLATLRASDGKQGLEILKLNAVDLIIVDLNMPGMDGIEFVRTVRAIPDLQDLPIIMLTTERREQEMKLAYDAGVNMYLVKPSSPAIIRYKVLSLLGLPAGDAAPAGEHPL